MISAFTHFVYFINIDYRIFYFCSLAGLDNYSWLSTDISISMTTNFCFIMNTTYGNLLKWPT